MRSAGVGTVIGSWKLQRKLGGTGLGAVYEARHHQLGRRGAMKVVTPSNDIAAERCFEQLRQVAQLEHPGIAEILDFGRHEDGTVYVVTEMLEGGETLATRIDREGRLPVELAAAIGRQLARALGAAHRAGLVHGEIEPENVVLVPDEQVACGMRVKLVDLGVGVMKPRDPTGLPTVGTPVYMAPEQCRGELGDTRSDVYAIGCLLYEMLCGRPPFAYTTAREILNAHKHETPTPPLVHGVHLPPQLEAAIMQALAKLPDERQQTMDELATTLGNRPLRGLEDAPTTTAAAYRAFTPPDVPVPMINATPSGRIGAGPGRGGTKLGFAGEFGPTEASWMREGVQGLPPMAVVDSLDDDAIPRPKSKRILTIAAALIALVVGGGILAVTLASDDDEDRKPDQVAGIAVPVVAPAPIAAPPIAAPAPVTEPAPATIPAPAPATAAVPATDPAAAPATAAAPAADPAAVPAPAAAPAADPASASASASASKPASVDPDPEPVAGGDGKVLQSITSWPPGAIVYRASDGQRLGTTPFALEIPKAKGEIRYSLHLDGFADTTVTLAADRDAAKRVELAAEKAVVKKAAPRKPAAKKTPARKTPAPRATPTPAKSPSEPIQDDVIDPFGN